MFSTRSVLGKLRGLLLQLLEQKLVKISLFWVVRFNEVVEKRGELEKKKRGGMRRGNKGAAPSPFLRRSYQNPAECRSRDFRSTLLSEGLGQTNLNNRSSISLRKLRLQLLRPCKIIYSGEDRP